LKAIMLMFDSLNRHMLAPYGCEWTHTPNFQRLAERTATFDHCYVGSMPCMPARRELHTGRYNFLHRSWGPLEPFDDSMPEVLRQQGVRTHLITDHYHYWEDGGCTYHSRFGSYEFVRGQEGDPWKGDVVDPAVPETLNNRPGPWGRQDWVNRSYQPDEEDFPQAQTMRLGMEYLRKNAGEDNWFLQLETFDPHEPYYVPQRYLDLYPHEYHGPHFDWPPYAPVSETPEQVNHLRMVNAALVSMCDAYLGKILDLMDELDLWKDTLLIVNTDHGFLLGEHDWWAKCSQPFYEEVAHTPLFIWDPRAGVQGQRRQSLVQTIDLAPTLLQAFGAAIPADMQGKALQETVRSDQAVHEAVLFGLHGAHVNVTDGRYVYMRAGPNPDNRPLYEYTLMPTHMRKPFEPQELQTLELAGPFGFSKNCRLLKIEGRDWTNPNPFGTLLFDLESDPHQDHPLQDLALEERMIAHLVRLMRENEAPVEQFTRLGLG
jgi:arylsulfatase A-like enzyme